MRIFSGIRPTGDLHIGNYLGAIKQWVDLQEENECVFCIVDWHAITTPFDPEVLSKKIEETALTYLAAGLNPEKCILFVQSQVKEHAELAWLLSCLTPLGELQRMTQFKEKSKKHRESVNAGLLNYPILMAADILLYKTEAVPVGEDQKQHVELTRTIARKFNRTFKETLKEPQVILPKSGAKIMSLQEPNKKMSKTDDDRGHIGLFDEAKEIEKKIGAAVTDTGKTIKYDKKKKTGYLKPFNDLLSFSGMTIKEIEKEFKGKGYAQFKKSLSQLLIDSLEPFRRKKQELLNREIYIKEILSQGAERARVIAQSTAEEVRKKMGLS